MGTGPVMHCSKCSKRFHGGKGYEGGRKNLCYDCLVPMADTIISSELNELGNIQRNFVGMIRQMGGLQAAGGREYWITMLKVNAGEMDTEALDTISDLSADAQGVDREFEKLSVDGEGAMLEKNYSEAIRIFQKLVAKFPEEGASYIRLGRALKGSGRLNAGEHLRLLNDAE